MRALRRLKLRFGTTRRNSASGSAMTESELPRKVLNEGARAGHWGLPGVRERAKLAGAKVDFWSEAGAGTEVQVAVPASAAYAKSSEARVFGLFHKKWRSHGE